MGDKDEAIAAMRELTGATGNRFPGGVQRRSEWPLPGMTPNRTETSTQQRRPMRGANVTDQVTPHDQDDGLFRTAGPDERQFASEGTDDRPMTRPSRNLFYNAANHEPAEHQRPATQRDEATMRSLRFPFDEDDCR